IRCTMKSRPVAFMASRPARSVAVVIASSAMGPGTISSEVSEMDIFPNSVYRDIMSQTEQIPTPEYSPSGHRVASPRGMLGGGDTGAGTGTAETSFVRRLLRVRLFYKILFANAAIVLIG